MGLKHDERLCPKCAESIKKAATLCKHCGAQIEAHVPTKAEQNISAGVGIGCLVLVGVLALGMCSGSGSKSSGEDAAKTAEERQKGIHCLSKWDGSNRSVVEKVKAQLRDPNSFEHVETKITPVNEKGYHAVVMQYRAKNGFGGMNVGQAIASVRQSDCEADSVITDN